MCLLLAYRKTYQHLLFRGLLSNGHDAQEVEDLQEVILFYFGLETDRHHFRKLTDRVQLVCRWDRFEVHLPILWLCRIPDHRQSRVLFHSTILIQGSVN